jgi:hypothetical protein
MDDRLKIRWVALLIDTVTVAIIYGGVVAVKSYLFDPEYVPRNTTYTFGLNAAAVIMFVALGVVLVRRRPLDFASRAWAVTITRPVLIVLDKRTETWVGIPYVGISHVLILVAFAILHSPQYRGRAALASVMTVVMLAGLELAARAIFPQPKFDPRLPYLPYVDEVREVDLAGVSSPRRYSPTNGAFAARNRRTIGMPIPRSSRSAVARRSAFIWMTRIPGPRRCKIGSARCTARMSGWAMQGWMDTRHAAIFW